MQWMHFVGLLLIPQEVLGHIILTKKLYSRANIIYPIQELKDKSLVLAERYVF